MRYLLFLLALGAPGAALAQVSGVGIGIATPRAGLDVNNDNGVLATGTLGTGTAPPTGAGTRLVWYTRKAAFRVGGVGTFTTTVDAAGTNVGPGAAAWWDDNNMANYSTAVGYACQATGEGGFAGGLGSRATEAQGFAYGQECWASGQSSVALGYGAFTNRRVGSFVFSDRSSTDPTRAGVHNSATWRLAGGFRLFTRGDLGTGVTIQAGDVTSNWGQSNAVISTSTGAYLSTSGIWSNSSDRRLKHRFEAVAGADVLAGLRRLPLSRWSYKADVHGVRHLGPMAQDFYRIFRLGQDSVSIGTVDADGVALAAAQALDRQQQAQQRQLGQLQAENRALRARLDRLEQRGTPPLQAALPWLSALLVAGLVAGQLRRRQPRPVAA